ncbi:MAG: DUF421 domain-containing protein [Oscillospiraceae bacterium]|nr:DUF421 domain-containing protein [Oscillospiraceae bacterium]
MNITLIRTVLLYSLLIFTVRMMGKRQVAEMEPAEFVVTMLLANLASVPMQDNGLPLISGLVPIFTVLSLELILAVLSMRFLPVRRLLCGLPAVLIRDGEIDQRALGQSRVSLDELTQKLREKDVFDLRAVKYAILETDGELSVMLCGAHKPVTVQDCGFEAKDAKLPYTLISDGVILRQNLKEAGYSLEQLKKELQSRGCRVRDVFLMTTDQVKTQAFVRKEKP